MRKRALSVGMLVSAIVLGCVFYQPYGEIAAYQLSINAQPIDGIKKNLSALTWNSQTNTLFATINKPAQIAELSLEGKLLRTIQVAGLTDLEAIEYIAGTQFVIADERRRHLYQIILTPATRTLDVSQAPGLTLNLDSRQTNSGFEGLAWNSTNQTLLVAQEKKPIKMYQIHGFPVNTDQHSISIQSVANANWMKHISDISALNYDRHHDRLMVLSHRSHKILFIPAQDKIKQLSLRAGRHGLTKTIPQPEGIATDAQGQVYLVSEPNLFYRFTPDSE